MTNPNESTKMGLRDRPVTITPQMVSAGIKVLCLFDSTFQSDNELVTQIYLAMEETRFEDLKT